MFLDPLCCDMAATCSHFNPHCQSLSFDNHNSDCALVSVDEMWPLRCSNYNASLSSVTYAPVWHGYSVVNSDVNRFNASDVDCCSLLEKVTLTSERAATGLASSQFDAEAVVPSELDRSVSEYGMNYANADDDEVSSLFKSSRQETSECNDSQIVRDFTSQPPALCVRGTVQTISPGCFFAKADERKFLTSLISDTSNYTPLNGRGSAHLLEYCDNMDASVPRPSLNLEKMQVGLSSKHLII